MSLAPTDLSGEGKSHVYGNDARGVSPALVPPCCSDCWAVMSLKSAEPWTLLRGYQLVKYTFECNI